MNIHKYFSYRIHLNQKKSFFFSLCLIVFYACVIDHRVLIDKQDDISAIYVQRSIGIQGVINTVNLDHASSKVFFKVCVKTSSIDTSRWLCYFLYSNNNLNFFLYYRFVFMHFCCLYY